LQKAFPIYHAAENLNLELMLERKASVVKQDEAIKELELLLAQRLINNSELGLCILAFPCLF
jgi:hypothetical protein